MPCTIYKSFFLLLSQTYLYNPTDRPFPPNHPFELADQSMWLLKHGSTMFSIVNMNYCCKVDLENIFIDSKRLGIAGFTLI